MASTKGVLMLWTVALCCCCNIVRCTFVDVGVKYHVILDVFSGREDPEWDVDEDSELYRRLTWALNSGPPTELDDDLGYRGFVVRATNLFGQVAWKSIGRNTDEDLEHYLLVSCPYGRIDRNVMEEVYSGIYGTNDNHQHAHNSHSHRRKKRQAVRVCSVSFEPDFWNISPYLENNNCYNYATNRRTNTFAQPGRGSTGKFTRLQAPDVYDACLRDGLQALSTPDAGRNCLIALVIWPGEDYHFYRLDNNGYWSHKPGRTPARDHDDSGNRITDPRYSDNGPYTVFAGFLGVGENISIR